MTALRQDLVARIRSDMGSDSPAPALFECLLDKLRPGAVAAVSPRMAVSLCPGASERDALALLKYLSRDNMGLFDIVFGAVTSTGDIHEISASEVRDNLERNIPIQDPTSGEELARSDVVVFFRGTPKLHALLGRL